jgi:hypothetical protein
MTVASAQEPVIDGFRHEALIYGSDEELLDVAVPFLGGGLEAGEPTLLRLPSRQQALVLDALDGAEGVTVLSQLGPLSPLSALRTTHTVIRRLAAEGCPRIRMLGDVPHQPWRGWVRYEAAVNRVLAPFPAWGLCPYDTRRTPANVIEDVERTHPIRSTRDLRGTHNAAFQDPLAVLEREAQRPDPAEHRRPEIELTDPSPATAGTAVGVLADAINLGPDAGDTLRLAVTAVVANARTHGRRPVVVRAWTGTHRVVATVSDAGPGPADLLHGVLATGEADDSSTLYHVREAVSEVSMFRAPAGFTVRLVQHRR